MKSKGEAFLELKR